jgi:hypothetical protein
MAPRRRVPRITFEVACARAMILLDLDNIVSVWGSDDHPEDDAEVPYVSGIIRREYERWAEIAQRLDPSAWERRFTC